MPPTHTAKNKIERLVLDLHTALNRGELNGSFGEQANVQTIGLFETAFSVELPRSFKYFLEFFNGGFITDKEADSYRLTGEYELAKQMSTRILSIEEITEEYENMEMDGWKLKPGFGGFYPYIPFCITPENEKLVFVDNYNRQKESAVFAAFHDEPASGWFTVADSFTAFLDNYIKTGGKPDLFDGDDEQCAEDNLAPLDGREEALLDGEGELRRSTAFLSLHPGSAASYTRRGNAYRDLCRYEEALADYKKSLELDDHYALTYYCRGSMMLSLFKPRQALTDFDSACQLAPDDVFYLGSRAAAFYELNRMDQALADCNRALELDDRDLMAYITRYKVYLYLGEATKAEADEAMIDELMAEDEPGA